ncbi:siroheme synthase CysG [Dysosmobacter sp.]|uniref:siroheme synthase CysG n=1 Tax=Dysosmobacter sp. TaxID=2591382 RepID=UPI002A851A37|nr:siroheme synthase CysG [Dysosmobacter sp.]MDY3281742.1 siroheme synthase CysG [Dysosmobacter sp.]
MPHFPLFIDLTGRRVLVVGGGAVAERKLRKLSPYGPRCTVVAPEVTETIAAMVDTEVRRRAFSPEDLEPRPALVIAATGDPAVNRQVSALCRERNIPVNVADDPALCTFLFPALVQQGSFSAGISTGGASPVAAACFKERLANLLPENLEELLDWLEGQRPALKAAIPDQTRRAGAFHRLFDACMEKGAPLTEEETARCVAGGAPMGSVALVGAGCGRADLITVRGLRLLQQCQAVVYDDLIDPQLLDAAPEGAARVYMGKRSGRHSAPQEEISRKLIELAQSGLQVVRLKGGDPYLFGRGGEEMLALQAAGIPCTEVPGIPSAIGIPAEAGIPVTHRGVSRGLHIVTAHTATTADGLPEDFDALARLDGTLVFLMGLGQLPKIVRRLLEAGKSGDTPAAVLSGGNSPHPVTIRSTLRDIEAAARDAVSPVVILVGGVAAMDLSRGPLAGVRVGVTGTAEIAARQCPALEQLGAETLRLAVSHVRDLRPEPVWETDRPHWLVFTSGNGVKRFFHQLRQQGKTLPPCPGRKFAVIGGATRQVLASFGIQADLCPEVFTSEALARALAETAAPEEEIILLRSAGGAPILRQLPEERGFTVRDVATYVLEAEEPVPLPERLDYLTFSSGSGVDLFFRQYGKVSAGTRCVCIGPVTARALERHTAEPYLLAEDISAAGLLNAILRDR